jgi:hypothetical protein
VAPVLDPGRGRTKQGYFWAIGGMTDRGAGPNHLPSPPATPRVAASCTRSSCSIIFAISLSCSSNTRPSRPAALALTRGSRTHRRRAREKRARPRGRAKHNQLRITPARWGMLKLWKIPMEDECGRTSACAHQGGDRRSARGQCAVAARPRWDAAKALVSAHTKGPIDFQGTGSGPFSRNGCHRQGLGARYVGGLPVFRDQILSSASESVPNIPALMPSVGRQRPYLRQLRQISAS